MNLNFNPWDNTEWIFHFKQRVDYIADPINGFRVAGTNIPVAPAAPVVVDTPEVAAAKAEFEKAFAAAAVAADE